MKKLGAMDFQSVISCKHILSISWSHWSYHCLPFHGYMNIFSILYGMAQSFVQSTHSHYCLPRSDITCVNAHGLVFWTATVCELASQENNSAELMALPYLQWSHLLEYLFHKNFQVLTCLITLPCWFNLFKLSSKRQEMGTTWDINGFLL